MLRTFLLRNTKKLLQLQYKMNSTHIIFNHINNASVVSKSTIPCFHFPIKTATLVAQQSESISNIPRAVDNLAAPDQVNPIQTLNNHNDPLKSLWLQFFLAIGYSTGLSMTALAVYACYEALQPRERIIKHHPLNLDKNPHHGLIVDTKNFTTIDKKPKGELKGSIVRNNITGHLYIKKGARSLDTLIKEFLISDFLALVRPGIQPNALIMQEMQEDGSGRLYTLSRIFPHSMDLEDFILQGNWKNKLTQKPLVGFEVAMAADLMFAKHKDMKLANYIVIETTDSYVVACIDHEESGEDIFHHTTFVHKINDHFISHIVDINEWGHEYKVGLYNHPEAREFMMAVKEFMQIENINAFYEAVANANPKQVIHLVKDIYDSDGLVSAIEGHRYVKKLLEIQKEAAIISYDTENAIVKARR